MIKHGWFGWLRQAATCARCGRHIALDCTERMADLCGCGICSNCRLAAWWRIHPGYVEWKATR